MTFVAPVLDGTFDSTDPADAQRFRRMLEELKVTVKAASLATGIMLHKWVDETHFRVLIFDSTLEGRGAAEALLAEGYDVGPYVGKPKTGLSDLVEQVKRKTAQLDPKNVP